MNHEYVLPPPKTPPPRPPRREDQLVGVHFTSPPRRRPSMKDRALVIRPDAEYKIKILKAEIAALTNPSEKQTADVSMVTDAYLSRVHHVKREMHDAERYLPIPISVVATTATTSAANAPTLVKTERLESASQKMYTAWLALIPTLVPEHIAYMHAVQGRTGGHVPGDAFSCPKSTCRVEVSHIACLYANYIETKVIRSCACTPLPNALVRNGLFPASPSRPRVAISIDLLDFYFSLYGRGAHGVTALSDSLKSLYRRRGFPVSNDKGEPIKNPFRRGLGRAIRWYEQLRSRTENLESRN